MITLHQFRQTFLVIFIVVLMTISCRSEEVAKQKTGASKEPIKVGVILPLSGAFGRYGQKIRSALQDSQPATLKYIFEDEQCNPLKAVNAYKKLSEFDNVKVFIGPWCGSPQIVVASQLKGKDKIAILPSSAPGRVYSLSESAMFSSQHTIEKESAFLAKEMNRLGYKKVAIVFLENDFSRAHEGSFRKEFKGEVVDTYAYTSEDISQLKSIALRAKQINIDAVYAPDAWPLMGGLMKELAQIGLNNLPVFSVYSAQGEDVLKVVGAQGENLFFSYPDIGDRDALDYFPKKASEMLIAAIDSCREDIECLKNYIKTNYSLDENGAVNSNFILKTISDGTFVPLKNLCSLPSQNENVARFCKN